VAQDRTTAGGLREIVAFDQRALQSDGYGNSQADWVERFRAAARIKPARGGETIQAARLAGSQPVVITVRSSSNMRMVKSEWRARDVRSGTIYNIRSIVNPDEKDKFIDMECDAGVAT
jgi:SPP1 family predicted phage head-tail adaptor